MTITTVGIDLAKNVFQVHGVDERGKAVLKKQLRRQQVAEFFAKLPVCLVGMEACGSAHHWARKLGALGHTVRLIAPQFVKPYVKSNKNDAADAEAICEAVSRPNMRFVPVKNIEQQAVLALHRARHGFVKARTAQANQIRGLLAEFGLIIPKGIAHIPARVPELLEDASNELPAAFRSLLQRLTEHRVLPAGVRDERRPGLIAFLPRPIRAIGGTYAQERERAAARAGPSAAAAGWGSAWWAARQSLAGVDVDGGRETGAPPRGIPHVPCAGAGVQQAQTSQWCGGERGAARAGAHRQAEEGHLADAVR